MTNQIKEFIKRFIPAGALSFYHLSLAKVGAARAGYPSKKLFVIGVTGTKGKSTVVELIRAILEEAGHRSASASTIGFNDGAEWKPNLFKMTMPGRFFLQQFLHRALEHGATHAVIEMTSEGARQHRHIGIELNALVFTNLQPEHLESHGGIEAYAAAKLSLARHLERSAKRPRIMVANADDPYGKEFLAANVEARIPFSLSDAEPYTSDEQGARFTWRGELMTSPLPGKFNLENILAALALCESIGIPRGAMKKALEKTGRIAGRAERIERGQNFSVIVDYAHTPDSLKALYETYRPPAARAAQAGAPETARKLLCVLGNTGGGRDTWKRPEMGAIADQYCDAVILTNEDPYEEDPRAILKDMEKGFSRLKPRIVLDRRAAIKKALVEARTLRQAESNQDVVVLITGKGTDPYIMGPRGEKTPWSDRLVAEEELDKLLKTKN